MLSNQTKCTLLGFSRDNLPFENYVAIHRSVYYKLQHAIEKHTHSCAYERKPACQPAAKLDGFLAFKTRSSEYTLTHIRQSRMPRRTNKPKHAERTNCWLWPHHICTPAPHTRHARTCPHARSACMHAIFSLWAPLHVCECVRASQRVRADHYIMFRTAGQPKRVCLCELLMRRRAAHTHTHAATPKPAQTLTLTRAWGDAFGAARTMSERCVAGGRPPRSSARTHSHFARARTQ